MHSPVPRDPEDLPKARSAWHSPHVTGCGSLPKHWSSTRVEQVAIIPVFQMRLRNTKKWRTRPRSPGLHAAPAGHRPRRCPQDRARKHQANTTASSRQQHSAAERILRFLPRAARIRKGPPGLRAACGWMSSRAQNPFLASHKSPRPSPGETGNPRPCCSLSHHPLPSWHPGAGLP